MEGVLVSAKRDGSPLTVTVVTDSTGRYGFPADRLEPGHYALHIRAIGYELTAPASADVGAGAAGERRSRARARSRTSPASSPAPNGSSACRARRSRSVR